MELTKNKYFLTKEKLREILFQRNSGELISLIVSLRIVYKNADKKYLVDEILNYADTNKNTLEREIKNNLGLNIEIV